VILGVTCVNIVVDPYRIFGSPVVQGLNALKPRAIQRIRESKSSQIWRVRPRTVILGNSRAEVGFDPRSSLWPAESHPVYNFAIPGSGIRAARDQFRVAVEAGHLKRLVLGVDFLDFLVRPDTPSAPVPPSKPSASRRVMSILGATLSIDAFVDSILTIHGQRDPSAPDLTPLGFNPMREYVQYARDEGYYGIFRQRYLDTQATLEREPKSIRNRNGDAPSFAYLEEILSEADRHHVKVDVVTYPYHVVQLLLFENLGLWPAFDEWKKLLSRVASSHPDVRFWDFAVVDDFTRQPVPSPTARPGASPWYWEPSHFKRQLGERVVGIVVGCDAGARCPNRLPNESDALVRHLANQRKLRDAYRSVVPRAPFEIENRSKLAPGKSSRRALNEFRAVGLHRPQETLPREAR